MHLARSSGACLLAGLIVSSYSAAAVGSEWSLVPGAGSVTMYATKQGAWFNGVFESFSAVIDFEPDDPSAGSIVGIVETGTIATGDSQNDDYVAAYLDVGRFPEARFESRSIEQTAEGYRASGDLTLKGTTRQAVLDFVFDAPTDSAGAASGAAFSGRMVIDRFAYDIASDVDTSWTGREVTVIVELGLER